MPNNKEQAVLLGFDFGLKQIGVAVGDTLTNTARPLKIFLAKDGVPQWEQIEQCIKEWDPLYLVVGEPLNMDGSESDMSLRAKKFAKRLHGRYGIHVELHDERLSSKEAKSIIKEDYAGQNIKQRGVQNKGKSRRIAHNRVDSIAATLILESWLTSSKQIK